MKIFRTVITSIVTICVLVSMVLCFGACGKKSEPNAKIETTKITTTAVPSTNISTSAVLTTAKPTQKITEPTTKKVEATKSPKHKNGDKDKDEAEDEVESGSDNSTDYVDDNDDVASYNGSNNSVKNSTGSSTVYSSSEFQNAGVINWGGYQWTYYSELILPGEGLDIPGRHTTSDGYVCDGDGYIVLAADLSMLPRYSVVDTPFGRTGKVYDTGCAYGVLDVYVGW